MVGFPAGNTGAQMGGWWRKEIKTVEDMKGVKFRVGGFAGAVLSKLGVVPQNIPGGDIYPALEKGTIDAAEWVGPYDDQKLGFDKVAKFYYYPGWWEGGAQVHVLSQRRALELAAEELPGDASRPRRRRSTSTCRRNTTRSTRRLCASWSGGACSCALLAADPRSLLRGGDQTYAEMSEKNADFKKVYESMRAFRNEQYLWMQVADGTYDNFMYWTAARGQAEPLSCGRHGRRRRAPERSGALSIGDVPKLGPSCCGVASGAGVGAVPKLGPSDAGAFDSGAAGGLPKFGPPACRLPVPAPAGFEPKLGAVLKSGPLWPSAGASIWRRRGDAPHPCSASPCLGRRWSIRSSGFGCRRRARRPNRSGRW